VCAICASLGFAPCANATLLARRLHLPLIVSLQGETVMDDSNIYDTSVAMRTSLRFGLRRADAVTVLDQGRTLAAGTPDEIRGNLDVAAAYLGETAVTGAEPEADA
jgi:hypothetical protein